MSDQPKQMTEDEAAEFAEQVFDVARRGDAAILPPCWPKACRPIFVITMATPC